MRSTVVLKVIMAITGLIMIGFLLMHMYGNLKAFLGAEAFDHYAEWLKGDILYPLLPSGWFIWIFRFVMVAAIVLHIYSAATLWRRAKSANPVTYEAKKALSRTYSARTMRWGGIILLTGLIFHLLQFTVKATLVSAPYESTPYNMVVLEFQNWWLVLGYAIWMVAVCMHIRHGFWSAFTTLGANTSPKARVVLNGCAWVVAILLYIGFMMMPVAVLTGVLSAS
ncbi:MAG: succinate dehydrogenase cytochrome b subunit [Propionicimonas sp.]|nr:succinate dehydrogenase cytochrome b subunit [Propionicimonas sp.]MEA4944295.1 succinate dehydrogenase cytochrome b subunit [Propionicimonas sp.]MEA5054543.1 succinate dehydrogenase cytochrome b subunit [Propionicimonas sp.]MEA5116053.1 succinate dehydrogenase cytochrome b subunit [Propionicimonas sp.]